MGHNPDLQFDEPVLTYQTTARYIEGENIFDIKISGPLELVNEYAESAPLILKMISTDEAREIINSTSYHRNNLDKGDPPPAYNSTDFEVEITVTRHAQDTPVLFFEEDPTVKQGKSRYYKVSNCSEAWATCQTSFGDADLYLYEIENGKLQQRDTSTNPDTQEDSVTAAKQSTGNWKLQVFGYEESTYTLTGVFVQETL